MSIDLDSRTSKTSALAFEPFPYEEEPSISKNWVSQKIHIYSQKCINQEF